MEARKPPVGSRPGTLAIDPKAQKPRIRVSVYDKTSIGEFEARSVEEIRARRASHVNLWVDVQGLGDEKTLRDLAELFSIHPLALEDVVHVPIRPKTEAYDDNLLVVSRMLRRGDRRGIVTEQVSLFIGRGYVLTFQEAHDDVLDPVRHRLRVPTGMTRRSGSDYLAYVILDTIIDAYYPVIEGLGDRIEELEERVLSDASPETLRELTEIKGTLLGLRRAVVPQREAINSLIRDEHALVTQPVRTYFRDTYDHIVQTSEAVEVARELVNGLMNTYLSVLSNRMNDVMKTLTIITSIFVPLTFMAGIYGMNFENMPELRLGWAYPALLSAMAVTVLGMLIYFRKKGWIGRR